MALGIAEMAGQRRRAWARAVAARGVAARAAAALGVA
jgi:hypothetical protein